MFIVNTKFVEFYRRAAKFQKLNLPPVPTTIDPPEKKISVVTTCMNRLHDLRETLPRNIEDNYGNVQFVLLDYGSRDSLGEWVRTCMSDYIEKGRLVYYYCPDTVFFCPNHSRNVSFRLATRGIVVNVDADNYMGEGFLKRINQCASVRDDKLLIVSEKFLLPDSNRFMLRGRFALYRDDIYRIGGFDEDLDNGFSHDDVSFVLRAMSARYSIVRFESKYTENRIETSDDERVRYVKNKNFDMMKGVNEEIIAAKLCRGIIEANRGKKWGHARVQKNWGEWRETV